MDDLDKRILNIIQAGFPVAENPFEVLGEQIGIGADEALVRVRALKESGIIRKLGASFDTRKVGHISMLVAAKVDLEHLLKVADEVSLFPEVTHNYGRDFEYNLWFTLVCESAARIDSIIEKVKSLPGVIDIQKLPSERMFKIKVDFEF